MAVTRSPFVKKQTLDRPQGYGTDEEGRSIYTYADGTVEYIDNSKSAQDTAARDAQFGKLANAVARNEQKAVEVGKQSWVSQIGDLAKGKAPNSLGKGWFRSVYDLATLPLNFASGEKWLSAMSVTKPVQTTLQSALNEIADGVTVLRTDKPKYDANGKLVKPSVKDFFSQAKDFDFSLFGEGGTAQYNNPFVSGALNFVAAGVTDPLSYATLPASAATKAGKIAMAMKAVELAEKYPLLKTIPNLFDEVARYGPVKIPAEVREAEKIFVGVKMFGKEIPNSSLFAEAWADTAGTVSAKVGDLLYRKAPKFQERITKPSVKPLVLAGIGRRVKSGQDWVDTYVSGLAHYSANNMSKGRSIYKELGLRAGIAKTVKEIQELPDNEQQIFHILVENRSGATTTNTDTLRLVDEFRAWRDETRIDINANRAVVAQKYGITINDLGFVEDHLYHSITDEAKQWLASGGVDTLGNKIRNGTEKYTKYFSGYKLSAEEIAKGKGIASYRKVRGPVTEADGTIKHSTFMDEVVMRGDINEINEISMSKLGIPWFKTDMPTILDDTIKSYGKMYGRLAYVERLMEFGPEVVKPLLKKAVPDGDLADGLFKIVSSLSSEQQRLVGRVRRVAGLAGTKTAVAKELQTVSDTAQNILGGGLALRKGVDDEVLSTVSAVDNIISRLRDIAETSKSMSAEMKGEFNEVWSAVLKDADDYRTALLNGDGERFIATKELRYEYQSAFPDAPDASDKTAEWLAERIVRAAGGADAVDAREAARVQKLKFLNEQRDLIPAGDTEQMAIFDNLIMESEMELEALARINAAKTSASYASEGLIYGFPPNPEDGPVPYHLFSTKPIDNEFGTFAQMPDALVGHAIPESQLLDLRDPETFVNFLSPEFWADDMNRAWDNVGVPDMIPEDIVQEMVLNNGVVNTEFIQAFPEKSEFLMGMYDMFARVRTTLETGDMPNFNNDELNNFFTWFNDMQQRLAYSIDPDNSDAVGNMITHYWFGGIVDDAVQNGYRGALMPLTRLFDDIAPDANEWAVLMPNSMPTPKVGSSIASPWQMANDNQFMQKIMDETLESMRLTTADKSALLRQEGIEIADNLAKRETLDKSIEQTSKQENAFNALMRLRNNDTVLLNNKEVPRQKVIEDLAKADEFLAKGYKDIDLQIAREIEKQFGSEELLNTQRLTYEERLPMLMNQAKVLETWTEGAGAGLQQEINDFLLLLANKPAKGSTGASNAAWTKHVERTLASSELLNSDPATKAAYDRVTTILHADEIALSKVQDDLVQALNWFSIAKTMNIKGTKIVEIAEKGWRELEGLGVQIPYEAFEQWMPALKRLSDGQEMGLFMKNLDKATAYWKRWVTGTVGFVIRNGVSANFMNYADGVTNDAIAQGFKWANAQNESVGRAAAGDNFNNWMQRAGITDPEEMAKAQWVTEVALATGHGQMDDFAAPTVARQGNVVTDKYLKFFQRKNVFIERAVRIPMAIDSFNKGHTFDEAVARISRIHFDYSDLSKLDASAKRLVPFWVWTTRNIPLQLTQLITRPKAYYEYNKLQESLPVNENIMMPKWIQDRDPLGIIGNWVLTPDLPHIRLREQFESFADPKQLAGQLTPAFRLPIELVTNTKLGLYTDTFNTYNRGKEARGYETLLGLALKQVMDEGKGVYTDKAGNLIIDEKFSHILETALPPVGWINRVTGGLTGGKESLEERMIGNILNWFGIPARQIGPVQEEGEAKRRTIEQDILFERLKRIGFGQGIGLED